MENTEVVSVRIPKKEMRKLKKEAKDNHMALATHVRRLLMKHLKKEAS